MSDHADERTEQPTRRRLSEAREEGRVPHSRDLQTGLFVLALSGVIALAGDSLISAPAAALRESFTDIEPPHSLVTSHAIRSRLAGSFGRLFGSLWPFWLVLPLTAVAATILQRGWIFRPQHVLPDPGRLNPLRGVARLFSADAIGRVGVTCLKVVLLSGLAWWWATDWSWLSQLESPVRSSAVLSATESNRSIVVLGHHTSLLVDLAARFAMCLGVGLVMWGAIDFLLQRRRHERSLRMTPQELRDEQDQHQTDPAIRQQQTAARQRLISDLPRQIGQASLILVDPSPESPRAVAIRFDHQTDPLPRIVAFGTQDTAVRMQQLAVVRTVPIIHRPRLLQAIWDDASAGRSISTEIWPEVAELLAKAAPTHR